MVLYFYWAVLVIETITYPDFGNPLFTLVIYIKMSD